MNIKRRKDFLNENLDRSYKGASKFGIAQDPNKIFRPNWLDYTRLEIANKTLESAFGDFLNMSDDAQLKYSNKFAQLLTDEDCQGYVDSIADFYENSASFGDSIQYNEERSTKLVNDKKFTLNTDEH